MGFVPASDAKLATISFAKLTSSAQTERDAEISRLRTVCETIGFFYLSDHGVPLSLIHRVFKASRGFFLLPEHVKMRWGQHAQVLTPRELRGYSSGVEQVNPGVDEDNKQFFELGNERPLGPFYDYPSTGTPRFWKRDNGAGRWAKACERGASCGCWPCM